MILDSETDEPTRYLVPMTTQELARAIGMARRAAANDDGDLADLADGDSVALHVEIDTEEGVLVRLADGADEHDIARRIEAVGGCRDLPAAA